jgi:formylglycine-generating enzyme required for sulfatase activity
MEWGRQVSERRKDWRKFFLPPRPLLGAVALLASFAPGSVAAQPFDLEHARRAVVRVFGDGGNRVGSGSVVKVSEGKVYILTAYHVIQDDAQRGIPTVEVEFYPDGTAKAGIYRERVDETNDLAVLVVNKLPASPPVEITWGSSGALKETDPVWALGHPQGGPGWVISGATVGRKTRGRVYFSGTAVDAGNSGGPLLDGKGLLVGVITSKGGSQGIAVGADVVQPIVRDWVPALAAAAPRPSTPQPSVPEAKPPVPAPAPAALPQVIRGKDGKEMVLVPAGTFTMGSTEAEIEEAYQLGKRYFTQTDRSAFTDEGPAHSVQLDAFYIDRQEVTVREYRWFQHATGHRSLPRGVATYAPEDDLPVAGPSWEDAVAYCRWAGKELPTEAQWEKAARGTDGRRYPWGNEPVDGRRANYCDRTCEFDWKDSQDDGYKHTAPVGSYPAGRSPYGADDLAGNVWEWVRDCYAEDYYGRSTVGNPLNEGCGKEDRRVLRGGGWESRHGPPYLRAAHRLGSAPGSQYHSVGFRCVVGRAAPQD